MNTLSHALINAALRKGGSSGRPSPIPASAFVLGAIMPDIPLTVLWLGTYGYYRYLLGDQSFTPMDQRLDLLYFTNPFWIAAHNLLHAPILLIVALLVLRRYRQPTAGRAHWWFWFAAGCLIHTALDIPTHAGDGPLLFFPLEWSTRFLSPISYWDPKFHGREFTRVESALDLILIGYLLIPWIAGRLRRRQLEPRS